MATLENSPATPSIVRRRSAVIVAGAAAKGPFAAGALAELAGSDRFDIAAVVGASSGALNGAVFAAGLRVGRAKEAAELLCKLWAERANIWHIRSYTRRKAIVREALEVFRADPTTNRTRFHTVVTSLAGRMARYGHVLAEQPHHFEPDDFRDPARLDFMAEVCVASSAIPFVFAPVWVNGRGPYWDGGVVNNAPISLAIHGAKPRGSRPTDVNHVIVVSPERSVVRPDTYGRFALNRLLEILVEERLARDIEAAMSFNGELEDLRAVLERLANRRVTLEELGPKLDWRPLAFTEIRPYETDLDGNALSGFFDRAERERYLARGRDAARHVLASVATSPELQPPATGAELRLPN